MDINQHRLDMSAFQANKTYHWLATDTKIRFEKFLKEDNQKKENLQYYLENPIEYKLNNFGFRTPDDFNFNDEGNLFIGCSHTIGIGLHLEHVWSYKLNQIIGGKFWNLGLAGTGVQTHFRLLLGFCKKLKIKNIFHYAPKYPRYEFIINGIPTHFLMNEYTNNSDWEKQFGSLCRESLINDDQSNMTYNSHIYAIKGLANELGINYYVTDYEPKSTKNDKSLKARDIFHFSIKQQHEILNEFLKMYDINLYNKYSNYDNLHNIDGNDTINNDIDYGYIKTKKTIF
jgi:hypothetical protein